MFPKQHKLATEVNYKCSKSLTTGTIHTKIIVGKWRGLEYVYLLCYGCSMLFLALCLYIFCTFCFFFCMLLSELP